MYQQQIIDHYKYPRNFVKLEESTFWNEGKNPVCGDEVDLYVKLDDENNVEQVGFQGKGCAISMASASLLTELLEDMNLEEMKQLTNEDIKEMLGIPLSPVRLKCAILSLKVLEGGIEELENPGEGTKDEDK